MSMSFFSQVTLASPDSILGLTAAFKRDERENKVNLGVGLYKDEQLHTPILKAVKRAEERLLIEEKSKEYLPIEGDTVFTEVLAELVFGKVLWQEHRKRICGVQTPGGTGALRIAADFLKKQGQQEIWIPNPTWANHRGIFESAGWNVKQYPYYDFQSHCVDFKKMRECLSKIPSSSIVLLHPSCHNPTGADFDKQQWNVVLEICKERRLLPFFDGAYQGLGEGIVQDVEPIRSFLANSIEIVVAVSQSKNFSLYGERVGALWICTDSKREEERVLSRLKQVIRVHYSNPPMHGAKIVRTILQDTDLRREWDLELEVMRNRIAKMRFLLVEEILKHGPFLRFSHLRYGRGMFGFTGLSSKEVERLAKEFGIYMTLDGRISLCGLNEDNLSYVAKALSDVGAYEVS